VEPQAETIVLDGEDGHSYECQIVDIFVFEEKEYALIFKQTKDGAPCEEEGAEDGDLVLMRLHRSEEQDCTFTTIEDDAEFDRVVAYIEKDRQEKNDE
jgi:hypothetical protein